MTVDVIENYPPSIPFGIITSVSHALSVTGKWYDEIAQDDQWMTIFGKIK